MKSLCNRQNDTNPWNNQGFNGLKICDKVMKETDGFFFTFCYSIEVQNTFKLIINILKQITTKQWFYIVIKYCDQIFNAILINNCILWDA